ncbi:hypothetical protein ABZS68_38610 [Streptomyces sp. NPDC005571]|uniref:hypothetical protein n=1 Tax=Streptomyces sp. NPDC005571 TaxID=3156888 RepID=UPI0033B4563D
MVERQVPWTVEDCRSVLHEMRDLGTWFEHHEDFDELYTWAHDNDSDLLKELRRRPEVASLIQNRAKAAWSHASDVGQASFWIAEELLCGGLPPSKATWVKTLLHKGIDGRRRLAAYERVTEQLRPTYGQGQSGRGVQRGGWVYLLGDAGQAAFKCENLTLSLRFFDEAWESRDALRPGTPETAMGIAHIATGYASTVGYLRDKQKKKSLLGVALVRLAEGRQLIRDHIADPKVRSRMIPELLKIGIAGDKIWLERCKEEWVGWITSAEHRMGHLQEAERSVWKATDTARPDAKPGSFNYASLAESDQPTAARFLLDASGAAEAFGDYETAIACAQKAMPLSQLPRHRLRADLQLTRLERDRTAKLRGYEQLLRDIGSGMFGDLQSLPQQRKQLSDAFHELCQTLWRLERPTASWFWGRLSAEWARNIKTPEGNLPGTRADSASGALKVVTPTVTKAPDAHSATEAEAPGSTSDTILTSQNVAISVDAPVTDKTGDLVRNLRREYVPGIVLALLGLAVEHRGDTAPPTPELLEALAMAENWRQPVNRGQRNERLPLQECRSGIDVARFCAETADEFAQGYAPQFRPEILINLAMNPNLDPEQRQAVAEETYNVSLETGRPGEAINALLSLVSIHQKAGNSDAVRAAVERVRIVINDTLGKASGTAELIDIASTLTNASAELAGLLAAKGYDGPAFNTAHAPIGALSRAFTKDPDLVKEFELVEQWQHHRTPDADQRLFDMMLDRVKKGGSPSGAVASPKLAEVAACFGRTVSFVQLLHTPPHGSWALGVQVTREHNRYWSSPLAVTPSRVAELRNTIWASATASRKDRPKRLHHLLNTMHAEVVRPWLQNVKASDAVLLVPHGDFAGLPVHAAIDHDYVIEQLRVGYLPNLNSAPCDLTVSRSALLGGWDSENLQGRRDVQAFGPRLQRCGMTVVSPAAPQQGRRSLLDASGAWGLVHVVAHGDLSLWPHSSASRLRLADDCAVSAGDWLHSGCKASLVFLNACSIGRPALRAGDLNGFPLALRVRGTLADVCALTTVGPEAAHRFATFFYAELPACDSLTAYRLACLKAIRGGEPTCTWVPYLHSGFPVRLPAAKASALSPSRHPCTPALRPRPGKRRRR